MRSFWYFKAESIAFNQILFTMRMLLFYAFVDKIQIYSIITVKFYEFQGDRLQFNSRMWSIAGLFGDALQKLNY